MTNIKIKNIYYMLSYAFRVLQQNNYKMIESEEFEKIEDLFAEILYKGVAQQLKQGLYREYITFNEDLLVMRGKLNLSGTIRNKVNNRLRLSCDYDELSENNVFNQILKTTMFKLIHLNSVDPVRKHNLKKDIIFFNNVDMIELNCVRWNRLKFQKNNRSYEMLMNICYFVYKGLLQTKETGKYKMLDFSDEHMEKLYEHFILEYYRQEHKELKVSSPKIDWNISKDTEESIIRFLPKMQSDIMLEKRNGNKTLIIDAKYYSKTLQTHFNKDTFHSNNLYQIYTYVKNYDSKRTGNVNGLLLYAKSDVDIPSGYDYSMDGNIISIRTLDLNADFRVIKKQLSDIVYSNLLN